jgi:hypothetical protein
MIRGMGDSSDLTPLVGGHLDTVSFVMNYFVEFRIDDNVLRCMTLPIVISDGKAYRFPGPGSRDALCALIDTTIEAAEIHEGDRLELRTDAGHILRLPLDEASRKRERGFVLPQAVHFVPADESGLPQVSAMVAW